MARLNYVEFPTRDKTASKTFFERAFGWSFHDFGPDYTATVTDDVDVGLDGSEDSISLPLAVIEVDDIDATLRAVETAGGVVIRPIFSFPGGRRFHLREPSGNELAVWCRAEH